MDGNTHTSAATPGTVPAGECFRARARECRLEAVRCRNRDDNLWAAHWAGRAAAFDEVATSLEVQAKAAARTIGDVFGCDDNPCPIHGDTSRVEPFASRP